MFPKNLSVTRQTADIWVNGQLTVGATTTVPFIGDAQPANSDLVSLQIGRMGVGKTRIFSDRKLQVGSNVDPKANGDIFVYEGSNYELIQENPFDVGLIPHFEYLAELREATA